MDKKQVYCRYCGRIIDSDSKYCIYCGAKVSYGDTLYDKAKKMVLNLLRQLLIVVLGTITVGFLSLIPFSIAYLLFPDALKDYREWMWNFSFTGGLAFLLGYLLYISSKLNIRRVAYIIIPLLIVNWGVMVCVRQCQYLEYKKKYEVRTQTSSLDNSGADETHKNHNNVFPTQKEMEETNALLPIRVGNVMFTSVSYDGMTKTQTFYYDYIQEIDESTITLESITQTKSFMVEALKEGGNVERIQAGVTYLYVYRSVDGRVLYNIHIDSGDL